MSTYLADRCIVYDGVPAIEAWGRAPEPMVPAMNKFLKGLEITFRRDPTNYRPRINKMDSVKDSEQKSAGLYFHVDAQD